MRGKEPVTLDKNFGHLMNKYRYLAGKIEQPAVPLNPTGSTCCHEDVNY